MSKKGIKLWIICILLVVAFAGVSVSTAVAEVCRTSSSHRTRFERFVRVASLNPRRGGCMLGTTRLETIFVPFEPWGCEVIVREVYICTGEVLWSEVRSVISECFEFPPRNITPAQLSQLRPAASLVVRNGLWKRRWVSRKRIWTCAPFLPHWCAGQRRLAVAGCRMRLGRARMTICPMAAAAREIRRLGIGAI